MISGMNDLALISGRALQSEETHFIHYYFGKKEAPHQSIPFYENLLFALALCRTRTSEGVEEGKSLLQRLLAYQLPSGLFPSYLHDFPFCHDRYSGVHLLPPLFWLLELFRNVLGAEMGKRLEEASSLLIKASLPEADSMPLHLQVKLGGALIAFGQKGGHDNWSLKGEELIDGLKKLEHSSSSHIPVHLADCMTGIGMLKTVDQHDFTKLLLSRWHPVLQCYQGPFQQINFSRGEPEVTLYDLYMGSLTGAISPRIHPPDPRLLQAALVFPREPHVHADVQMNYSAIPGNGTKWGQAAYPFAFFWGVASSIKTLLLHPSNIHSLALREEAGACHLQLELGSPINPEEREDAREVVLSFPCKEPSQIRVNGAPATTFRSGDRVTIEDDQIRLELVFKATEGVFQGHLAKGNCPSEKRDWGADRFKAYHWLLFWRTISRSDPCHVEVEFTYAHKP